MGLRSPVGQVTGLAGRGSGTVWAPVRKGAHASSEAAGATRHQGGGGTALQGRPPGEALHPTAPVGLPALSWVHLSPTFLIEQSANKLYLPRILWPAHQRKTSQVTNRG